MIFFSSTNYITIFNLLYIFNCIFYVMCIAVVYGVDYIFTEFIFNIVLIYSNLYEWISHTFMYVNLFFYIIAPLFVKVLIGYCHFYYQLGYGLIFYIYLFRRYKAKKTNNWKSFYGNSILNWILFCTSTLNKCYLNKNFMVIIKNNIWSTLIIIKFLITRTNSTHLFVKKIIVLYEYITRNFIKYSWTPIFKRSSYISFFNSLKRFGKRK